MEQRSKNQKLLRSAAAVSIATLFSRIFGYLRDMLQAFYLGTGKSGDAFTIAFLIPNLLRRLTAEGAMTAAFIPVFSQMKEEKTRKKLWDFANAFFFDLTLVMTVLTIIGVVLSPLLVRLIAPNFVDVPGKIELTVLLTRIMFPYVFLISLAALIMAILNTFHKFFVPAFTPVLFNLAIISLALFFAGKAEEPAFVFAAGVVLGGVFQLSFQIPYVWRKGMRFKPLLSFTHPAVRKVARLMIPGIFGAGIYQINMAISRKLATSLVEGSATSLYYASRVQELTLGLFSIALSIALLPTLSELAVQNDTPGIKKTLAFSMKMVVFITFPAMMGLLILNRPIVQVLYQRGVFDAESTSMTASCLLFFAFGLPFISGVRILAPAFYSLKDTRTPVVAAFFVTVIYIVLSVILMGPLKVGGIALALSLSSVVNFAFLYILLERKIGKIRKKTFLISAAKSAFSAGIMGISAWFFLGAFDFFKGSFLDQLAILLAAIMIGILIYYILSLVINKEDLSSFKMIISRKGISKKKDNL